MRSRIVLSAATRLRRYGNLEDWMMEDVKEVPEPDFIVEFKKKIEILQNEHNNLLSRLLDSKPTGLNSLKQFTSLIQSVNNLYFAAIRGELNYINAAIEHAEAKEQAND